MSKYQPPSISTLQQIPDAKFAENALHLGSRCNSESVKSALDAGHVVTYADLRRCIRAAAARLIVPRTNAGDVVATVLPNGADCVLSVLAPAHAACIVAPLNPNYTADEFAFYLEDARAKIVLVPESTAANDPISVAATRCGAQLLTVPVRSTEVQTWASHQLSKQDSHGYKAIASGTFDEDDEVLRDRLARPEDVALFLHTSGTTSRPKGVPLSHKNLCTSIKNIANTYRLSKDDGTVLVMPLFHVHGLMCALLATLATGGKVALPPSGKFSASNFWPTVQESSATWYTAVPTIHQILLSRASSDYPTDSSPRLRFIRSCSASLAPAVLEKLNSTFRAPVLEAYAMTEAAHQMTSNPLPEFGAAKAGTVGLPQNVRVATLDENNNVLPRGEIGEVCIQGENVTKGYQNNPEANASAFAGGWFHTGDQGVFDSDGYLRLTGRIKELINRGGEKISPLEVDAALLAHPNVVEAVSFAVPDEKYGEEVNAAIVPKSDNSDAFSVEDLTIFVKGRLADFKIPKRFFVCSTLPRTATGKIQRRIVARHFLEDAK